MIHREGRIYFQYQNMIRIALLFLTGVLAAGCAAAPHPSIDVYMEPIGERFNAEIDQETGTATVVKNGVAVTIEPLDEVELFALTEDPKVNPYLIVERNGAVEPIYTVFGITVHNRQNRRVLVDDRAVLIDAKSTQYANLSGDYFAVLYEDVDVSGADPWHAASAYTSANYHSYYRHYQSYVDTEALEWERMVIEDSIFKTAKLFSGAKRSGLLIFDRLPKDATDIRIVVPGVRIVHPDGKEDRLEFKLDFRQILQQDGESPRFFDED